MIDGFTISAIVVFALLLIPFVITMNDLRDIRNLALKIILMIILLVLAIYLGQKDFENCRFLIFGIIASILGVLALGLFRRSEMRIGTSTSPASYSSSWHR